MNVAHLPFDRGNPYQQLLIAALRRTGVDCQASPWTWRLRSLIEGSSLDILHFHWTHYWAEGAPLWKFSLGLPIFGRDLARFKRRGGRVVWTVHNLQGHERLNATRDRIFTSLIARAADAVIAHTNSAAELVSARFSLEASRVQVIPHGNYTEHYPNDITQEIARHQLGIPIDETVILFFGALRPYKGILELISAFRSMAVSARARLLIAGRPCDPIYEREIRTAVDQDPQISLHATFVPDLDVQLFMNAADVVVFPYRDMLTSGALVLAMSFGRPSIVPDFPMMLEVAGESAVPYDGSPKGLAAVLGEIMTDRHCLSTMGAIARDHADEWSWANVASSTAAVYRDISQ